MERRRFLSGCAMLGGTAAVAPLGAWPEAWAQSAPRTYERTRLVDVNGRPIRLAQLEPETNYVFQYPYAATPCLLLKLRKPVAIAGVAQARGRPRVRVAGRRGARAQHRRVLRDLRAQARVSDARSVVHPLPARAVGDVGRAGDPLLRRPQRVRPGGRRARGVRSGAAAARGDPARARRRGRRHVRARHRGRRAVRRVLRQVPREALARIRRGRRAAACARRPSCASSPTTAARRSSADVAAKAVGRAYAEGVRGMARDRRASRSPSCSRIPVCCISMPHRSSCSTIAMRSERT